jgi:hypothetical protein
MGCKICLKKTSQIENDFCPEEKEIKFLDYKSANDDLLEIIERTYNFFTLITLKEYLNLLETYTVETSTTPFEGKMRTNFSSKDEFLTQVLTVDEFHNFIENKIIKASSLIDTLENNNLQISSFKEAFIEIFNSLLLKLGQNFDKQYDTLPKRDLIAIGLLFCDANNIDKIKVLFDIFKDDNNEFASSPELNEFLMCLFLISSYCMISARKKASNYNEKIPALNKEDIISMLKVSELKDSQNLLKVFNENFFKKTKYDWNEFKTLFENKETGFGWLLSSNGIRKKLEENDV